NALLRPFERMGEDGRSVTPLGELRPEVVSEVVLALAGERGPLRVFAGLCEAQEPVPTDPSEYCGLPRPRAGFHHEAAPGVVVGGRDLAERVVLPSVGLDLEDIAHELHRVPAPLADAVLRASERR